MELPTPKRDMMLQQLLMALAFAIPWAKKGIPTIIGFIVLIALIRYIRRKDWTVPLWPTAAVSLASLFLLLVAGTAYSEHPNDAWNEIGIKCSFLIFPFLAFITPALDKREVSSIHRAFVAGCFLFIAITITHAAIITLQHHDWYYLTYDRLSWYMHPTYAAAYQAMALYILIEARLQNKVIFKWRGIDTVAILTALIYVALLSSKAGYLCALLVVAFAVYRSFILGLQWTRIITNAILVTAVFIVTILVLPTTSERVEHAVRDIQTSESTSANADTAAASHTSSTQVRLITWSAGWELLGTNPFGTGTGDTQPELDVIYERNSEHYAAARHFNTHNQFLQTGAEIGWFGLAALCICLGSIWNIGRFEHTARLFVLLCLLNFLFESFLEVQAGIVFFSFWTLVYSKEAR
jgi:O-antigen ligase